MYKRWTILSADAQKVSALQSALNIHPAICKILVERGIETFEQAKNYYRPSLDELHDPWLMKDMDKAVARIMTAMEKKEKILIFGDYDVDGTTSVACMYRFLITVYDAIDFYIPHRYREGYGVSKTGIDYASENGFSLVISLDCGIKSIELIGYAKKIGIDFIVCDHHMPDATLPPAMAILNPKQADCPYPYKDLCGCGVGFKLISALAESLNLPREATHEYLDLVATAIAADIVPMTGENRVLVYYGLKKANENPNNGIRALAEISGLIKPMKITNLVFMIAPRINAAGRMDDARKAVSMFVAEQYEKAFQYAEMLHSDNTDRREADSSITDEALALIKGDETEITRKSTVVFQPHWHKGVVGIVASRLIEHFYRPTVVLTQSGEYAAGSARSVPGFNLYEAVHACKEYLIGYGGHFAAAGLTIELEHIPAFRDKFEEVVASTILPDHLTPEIRIDCEISLRDITSSFYNIISQMEPFGPENPVPHFVVRNVYDTGFSKLLKDQHLRASIRQDNITMTGIGFSMPDKLPLLQSKQPVDLVFRIDENEWNGQKSLQLKLVDLRASEPSSP